MSRTIAVAAAVAILMALAVTQTCAVRLSSPKSVRLPATSSVETSSPKSAVHDVWMADFLLLRVRCPAGGYTVQQRANAIEMRANNLLKLGGFDLATVKVWKSGNDALLYANGQLLVTVDPCTAMANDTTPERLANLWAQRLRTIYPKVVPEKPLLKRPSP